MKAAEQLRAFIERVKGEHANSDRRPDLCDGCPGVHPCDAHRAVLALEGLLQASDKIAAYQSGGFITSGWSKDGQERFEMIHAAREALARAAQKIGGPR